MLSLRMGSGAEMVLWYIIPRRFNLLQPRRVTRYFSTLYRSPHVNGNANHGTCSKFTQLNATGKLNTSQHSGPTQVTRRHNTTNAGQWTGWRYWFAIWKPLPLSVGLAVLAILQWRRIVRRNQNGQVETRVANHWEITFYRAVPLRALSRVWGWLSEQELPVRLRPWLYGRYARTFGCNLEEAANGDLNSYKCLSDFFCRELKDDVRPIHRAEIVSPADGTVLTVGRVDPQGRVEQVKGISYSLLGFLGEPTWKTPEVHASEYITPQKTALHEAQRSQPLLENTDNCLYQCVVYLAPGDYHRFHSPVQWQVDFRRHFQGDLLSVNPRVAKWIPELLTLNERAVYVGRWKHGFFSFTAVGATNVGSIKVYCDQGLVTNERRWRDKPSRHRDLTLQPPPLVTAGEGFGEFRLGSTVVLLFEAPRDFNFVVTPGQKIRVGEPLCPC